MGRFFTALNGAPAQPPTPTPSTPAVERELDAIGI
jgi:hypothetical protein